MLKNLVLQKTVLKHFSVKNSKIIVLKILVLKIENNITVKKIKKLCDKKIQKISYKF